MAYQVWLTARAERDTVRVIRYLAKSSRATAARWFAGLETALQSLEENPQRCSLAPEADALSIESCASY
jgi:plasmid stabilization system protein ParE